MSATPVTLPSAEEEIWRYSRIAELDLGAYETSSLRTETIGADAFRVGVPTTGIALTTDVDVFARLNSEHVAAHPQDVVCLHIPRGKVFETPIEVVHTIDTSGIITFPRLVIDAGEDSEATVIERFISADGITSVVCPVLEVRAAQSARITYVAINQLGLNTWQIAHQQSVGYRDSNTRLFTVALGGDYARVRVEARLVEQGASTQQVALYFAGGSQMHDFRTLQVHAAPKTSSDLLFKGAVRDVARSVYTGLIHIKENAKGSQAYQTNRNLTLSEGAWAESVPNLEIETNDVKCSHASTVGPIDEDQRFYLESRGVPPSVAERLVVMGFFNEVIDRLPSFTGVDALRAEVARKLLAEHIETGHS
ncbi:MAG: Fe-S cluster assembly protein SufD [Ilumatobacteraceae bacterium]|nr:Fe-S cluster assembly protein SufD [Ilumatobacteraceae bacterium]